MGGVFRGYDWGWREGMPKAFAPPPLASFALRARTIAARNRPPTRFAIALRLPVNPSAARLAGGRQEKGLTITSSSPPKRKKPLRLAESSRLSGPRPRYSHQHDLISMRRQRRKGEGGLERRGDGFSPSSSSHAPLPFFREPALSLRADAPKCSARASVL